MDAVTQVKVCMYRSQWQNTKYDFLKYFLIAQGCEARVVLWSNKKIKERKRLWSNGVAFHRGYSILSKIKIKKLLTEEYSLQSPGYPKLHCAAQGSVPFLGFLWLLLCVTGWIQNGLLHLDLLHSPKAWLQSEHVERERSRGGGCGLNTPKSFFQEHHQLQ